MSIKTTGNARIDQATAEIALYVRGDDPRRRDQACYDEATRLRDEILAGVTEELTALAAQVRKAVSYPAFADRIEAHTSGMAELVARTSGRRYAEVRQGIVDAAAADTRTVAQASEELPSSSIAERMEREEWRSNI